MPGLVRQAGFFLCSLGDQRNPPARPISVTFGCERGLALILEAPTCQDNFVAASITFGPSGTVGVVGQLEAGQDAREKPQTKVWASRPLVKLPDVPLAS